MPLGYVILSKVVPCPLQSCFILFMRPIWAHNIVSIIFWQDNQKQLALGREILYIPLEIQAFIFHVS